MLLVLFSSLILAQELPYNSIPERFSFALHLAKNNDPLRAALELEIINAQAPHDSLTYRIALMYQRIERNSTADSLLLSISQQPYLLYSAMRLDARTWENGADTLHRARFNAEPEAIKYYQKMDGLRALLSLNTQGTNGLVHGAFTESPSVNNLLLYKAQISFKNPWIAGGLSAIVPGLGRIYAGRTGDGITSLIVTGLFTTLAVLNFNQNHSFRAWLFTGLSAWFYTGQLYGSANDALMFNAEVIEEYTRRVNEMRLRENDFIPEAANF